MKDAALHGPNARNILASGVEPGALPHKSCHTFAHFYHVQFFFIFPSHALSSKSGQDPVIEWWLRPAHGFLPSSKRGALRLPLPPCARLLLPGSRALISRGATLTTPRHLRPENNLPAQIRHMLITALLCNSLSCRRGGSRTTSQDPVENLRFGIRCLLLVPPLGCRFLHLVPRMMSCARVTQNALAHNAVHHGLQPSCCMTGVCTGNSSKPKVAILYTKSLLS